MEFHLKVFNAKRMALAILKHTVDTHCQHGLPDVITVNAFVEERGLDMKVAKIKLEKNASGEIELTLVDAFDVELVAKLSPEVFAALDDAAAELSANAEHEAEIEALNEQVEASVDDSLVEDIDEDAELAAAEETLAEVEAIIEASSEQPEAGEELDEDDEDDATEAVDDDDDLSDADLEAAEDALAKGIAALLGQKPASLDAKLASLSDNPTPDATPEA